MPKKDIPGFEGAYAITDSGDIEKRKNIGACARGKRNSAYGYFWRFKNGDIGGVK